MSSAFEARALREKMKVVGSAWHLSAKVESVSGFKLGHDLQHVLPEIVRHLKHV